MGGMRLRVHGLAAALVAAVCGGCIALSGLTLTLVPAVATSRGTATVKVPKVNVATSSQSFQFLSSQRPGCRMGK